MKAFIRRMRQSDLGPLYELLSDPSVMRFLEPPFTLPRTERFLTEAGLCEPPLIYAAEDELGFAGYVIFHEFEEGADELGWVLLPRAQGRGLASSLTETMVASCRLMGRGAVIECAPGSAVSRHIALSHGFYYEGEFEGLERYRLGPEGAEAIRLEPMTREMYHEYYREYANDPELFIDKSKFKPYVYDPGLVDFYIERQRSRGRLCFAVMLGREAIGELIVKDIVPGESAALGLCMKNDSYKGHGYGSRAERLAIDRVFYELDIPTVLADAVITNSRSRHVMEKVGFRFIREEGDLAYYRYDRPPGKERE
ncbi:MAG: GNAT family N-acetyltransferase [Clostridia bacterium]|nr:GNAT family N-acetyltransferase [Clostridia bacterium]